MSGPIAANATCIGAAAKQSTTFMVTASCGHRKRHFRRITAEQPASGSPASCVARTLAYRPPCERVPDRTHGGVAGGGLDLTVERLAERSLFGLVNGARCYLPVRDDTWFHECLVPWHIALDEFAEDAAYGCDVIGLDPAQKCVEFFIET